MMRLLLWLLFLEDVTGGEVEVHSPHFPNCATPLMKLPVWA